MASEVVLFDEVEMEGAREIASFSIPAGSLAVLCTKCQDLNDLLVRLILGLSSPENGKVSLFGQILTQLTQRDLVALRRRVGLLQPTGGLISNLKVEENLLLPLEFHGKMLNNGELEERKTRILERLEYDGNLMDPPALLTLYGKRRIGMARAMLSDPELMIYNGGLTGLSDHEREVIIANSVAFHGELPGRTSLFITANPEMVRDIPFDVILELK